MAGWPGRWSVERMAGYLSTASGSLMDLANQVGLYGTEGMTNNYCFGHSICMKTNLLYIKSRVLSYCIMYLRFLLRLNVFLFFGSGSDPMVLM